MKQKPSGYWKNWENVVNAARELMQEHNLSEFPSQGEIFKLRYSGLSGAISKHHGGYHAARERLAKEGIKSIQGRRETGYWTEESVKEEVERVMRENNWSDFPSQIKLKGNYAYLLHAINSVYGPLNNFLSVVLSQDIKKITNGQWSNLDFTLEQARKVKKQNGLKYLPNGDELSKLGYASLRSAISKYHGGFFKFRQLLEENNSRRENGKLKNLDYVIEQFIEIKRELGLDELPSGDELRRNGHGSLVYAVSKYHGGMENVRKILNEAVKRVKPDSWQDTNYVVAEAVKVMEKRGFTELPGSYTLRKLGYSSLASAIVKYHSGFAQFRQKLNKFLGREESNDQLESLLENYVGGNA